MNEDIFQLGIKGLITNENGHILLLKVNTKKFQQTQEPYWDIPGGRVQRGDSIEDTLLREIEEETGLTTIREITPVTMIVSNIRIPVGDTDSGLILSIYKCTIDDTSDIQISEEHTEYAWTDKEEAAKLLEVKYPQEFTTMLLHE